MRTVIAITLAFGGSPAAAVAHPVAPGSKPAIADFLSSIGGDTSPKTVRGDQGIVPAVMKPLERDRGEILGYRFHKQYTGSNGTAFAESARAAFNQECLAKGGMIERESGPITSAFLNARAADRSLRREGMAIVLTGIASICLSKDGKPLGGFLGMVRDTSPMLAKGYAGSPFLMQTSGQPSRTAVYAYRASAVPTLATIQQEQELRRVEGRRQEAESQARIQEQYRRLEEFERTLQIGTETHCGTVIQLRGPMAELALPPGLGPSGQSSFWSRRDRLEPPGVSCGALW